MIPSYLRRRLLSLLTLLITWSVYVSQKGTSTLTAFLSLQNNFAASALVGLTNEHLPSEETKGPETLLVSQPIALNTTGGVTLVFCEQCENKVSCVDQILKQISSVFCPIEIRHAITP